LEDLLAVLLWVRATAMMNLVEILYYVQVVARVLVAV
jgi:hypothetical protein